MIRVVFVGRTLEKQWVKRFKRDLPKRVRTAFRAGAQAAADDIISHGRANIAQSGNFGIRWTRGLYAQVGRKYIYIRHGLWFAHIHEYGGTIRAKNSSGLLWIPLSFASDAKGVWARDYHRLQGGLFRINRPGRRPLLLSKIDKQPKYFGIPQVTIPRRWNIRGISYKVMQNFGTYYSRNF